MNIRNAQHRRSALVETVVGTTIGFAISWAMTVTFSVWLGWGLSASGHLGVTAAYTIVSIIRGYLIRRMFAYWQIPKNIEIKVPTSDERKAP